MLDRYPFHDALESRTPAIGLILNLTAPALVEIGSLMGFDFILIDAEHGPIDAADAEPMIRVAERARIAPLVRVPSARPDIALRFLDLGAVGIVFPHIKDAAGARAAVDAVRFPPLGKRGVAPSTDASGYGVRMPFKDYIEHANRLLLPMMIVEEPEAVENIEEIVEVDGIAAVIIGQMDLCASMGFPGDPNAPEVLAAVEKVMGVCKDKGLPVCLPGGSMEVGRRNLDRGATMLFTPIGSWLAGYGRAFTDGIRNGR